MKDLAQRILDTAVAKGAQYADVRVIDTRTQTIAVRNEQISALSERDDLGFGVRVLVNGAWGFSASSTLTEAEADRCAAQAVQIAAASASLKGEPVRLAEVQPRQDTWQTPYLIDPFAVPLSQKLDLLYRVNKTLTQAAAVKVARASMSFKREHQIFASSEGTRIEQTLLRSGSGYSATAVADGEVQVRSYPASFGGQYMCSGYELVESLDLEGHAERVRDEAVGLLTADPCPSTTTDLILDGAQMALQIHESVGHATELDRVLGMEADFAGTSFATPEKLRNFTYGSEIVNLVADSTVPTGLATIGYDDDGVPAQRWHIVQDGLLTGYLTNREVAHAIDESTSRGCSRADGWSHIPIVRITNLSLMPGAATPEQIVEDTTDGIWMETNKSWSIDQMRLNFQFGCEIAWEIKNGKRGRMLKNPTYQGITPQFWASCDAIGNADAWRLWGVANCGKGQPMQVAEMSHGAAPTRFRNVAVGIMGS